MVLSVNALGRIAAQEARNDAPSAQWRVLSILEAGDTQRVGALALAARTTQPGMTRLLGDLERASLIERSTDPEDSRATLVSITEEGGRTLRAWRADFRAVLAPRFAALSDDDWQALTRAAEILHERSTAEQTGAQQ